MHTLLGAHLCDPEGSTFAANLAALRVFYRWAAVRYTVVDPVVAVDDFDLRPHGVRGRRVKWLDPGGYQRWRDVGLRGQGLDERELNPGTTYVITISFVRGTPLRS